MAYSDAYESCGFDAYLLEELSNDYECPVCNMLFCEPIQTQCGHRLCLSCSEELKKRNGGELVCPLDKSISNFDKTFPDKAFERHVLQLKVKCKNVEKNCPWTGELRLFKNHISYCEYQEVKCLNTLCSALLLRKNLNYHMENQCTFCLHTCQYCLQNIFNLEIQAHLNVCECLPLDCVNQCGLRILRKEMFSHITDDCFNTLVPCQYINIGCNYKEMRKYTDAHAKTSAQNHLSLALTKLTLLEKNFDSTEKEKEEMKQQLLKLKRLKDTKTQKHVEALVEQIYSSVRNQSFVQLFISFCKKCSTKELRIGFLLLSIVILLIKVFHSFLQEYPFWITKVYLVFCFIENNAGDIHKLKNKKTVFSIIFWSIVVLSICVIDNCLRGYLIWSFGIICTICVINGLIKDTHTPEDKETVFDILLSSIVILTICLIDNFLQGYPVWIIGIIMAVCVIDNICKEMYISKVEDMNFRIIFWSTAFLKLCFFDYCLRGYPFWMNGAFFYCIIIWGNPVTDKIITKQRSHAIIFWFILIFTTCVFDRYLQGYPIWMFGIILIAAIAIESIYGGKV